MSIIIRSCRSADELRAALLPLWHYFGRAPAEDQVGHFERLMTPERVHAAWEDGEVVGGAGAFAFALTIPGGHVQAAGISAVGVLPSHRRRGVLRALMRSQLDACRERGEPIAYLWATEERIYGRFGFGMTSLAAEIELPRERSEFYLPYQPCGKASIVPVGSAEELISPVYAQVADRTPGMFARTSEWWQLRVLADPDWRRQDAGALQCAVVESDGKPAAYALYRVNPMFDHGIPNGTVGAVEVLGRSPDSTRAIWRYLLDMDLSGRIRATLLPLDHPLVLVLAEPRRMRFTLRDGTWIRLVDVEAALMSRSLQGTGAVVIDLVDEFCPWNAGRWRIADGTAERTSEPADLRCDVSSLGSVFLGGFTWLQLFHASRLEELRPNGVLRADLIFRTHSAPWCPEYF